MTKIKTKAETETETETTVTPATLEQLLALVDKLFDVKPALLQKGHTIMNYSLDRFPHGWNLDLNNDWERWSNERLVTSFGPCDSPNKVVLEFLNYVQEKRINVSALTNFKIE